MGLYIFSWQVLRKILIEDHDDESSEHDFGKNIIPNLLSENKKLYAYTFKGYWKDVGTIDSYYDTAMSFLDEKPEFDIFNSDIKIFSNLEALPPHFVGEEGKVVDSIVCNGCMIYGEVNHSILSTNVYIGKNAKIIDSILLPGARVKEGAILNRAIIGENTTIESNVKLGSSNKKEEIALVGDNEVVKK